VIPGIEERKTERERMREGERERETERERERERKIERKRPERERRCGILYYLMFKSLEIDCCWNCNKPSSASS
jgi:hypothetical protein